MTLPKVFKLSGCLGPAARQKAEHAASARNALQLTTCRQRNATLNSPQFAPSKHLSNSDSEKKLAELLSSLIQKPVGEAKCIWFPLQRNNHVQKFLYRRRESSAAVSSGSSEALAHSLPCLTPAEGCSGPPGAPSRKLKPTGEASSLRNGSRRFPRAAEYRR